MSYPPTLLVRSAKALFPLKPLESPCVKIPVEGRLMEAKSSAVAGADRLYKYGVESNMSVTPLGATAPVAVALPKYCSALELIPGKSTGLSVAPKVDG